MTPSEYQQLTDFFVDHLDRLRSFVGETTEALRSEIRIVADGVLTNGRRIAENTRVLEQHGRTIESQTHVIEMHGRKLDEHGRKLDEQGRAIGTLSERVGDLEDTVGSLFQDHESRIRALEGRAS
jgi:hypothetical protein